MFKRWLARIAIGSTLVGMGVLVWLSQVIRTSDECIGDVHVLSQLLLAYAKDHHGNLPSGPEDLIGGGYCRVDAEGRWELVDRSKSANSQIIHAGTVRHPERFDIAWSTCRSNITERGTNASDGRLLIGPAADSPCSSESLKAMSIWLAGEILEATNTPKERS
jgi:hypothetical protein